MTKTTGEFIVVNSDRIVLRTGSIEEVERYLNSYSNLKLEVLRVRTVEQKVQPATEALIKIGGRNGRGRGPAQRDKLGRPIKKDGQPYKRRGANGTVAVA